MKYDSLPDLIAFARSRSKFYADFYRDVKQHSPELTDLPVLNTDRFLRAVSSDQASVLTDTAPGGLVLMSGCTSGFRKITVFSASEWEHSREISAQGLIAAGIDDGDRVANFGPSGDLYGSLLMIHGALWKSRKAALEYPMGKMEERSFPDVITVLNDFQINVIVGVPTYITKLAAYYLEHKKSFPNIRVAKFLYFGEGLRTYHHETLQRAFPGVQINSMGHSITEVGMVGCYQTGLNLGEHRTMTGMHVELLDENGLPIEKENVPGDMVVTVRYRKLMPILRYPIGDRAEWVSSAPGKDRVYRLLGRAVTKILENCSLTLQDIEVAVKDVFPGLLNFQILVQSEDGKPRIRICVVTREKWTAAPAEFAAKIQSLLGLRCPDLAEAIANKTVHPLSVVETTEVQLIVSQRTGKVRPLIDQR